MRKNTQLPLNKPMLVFQMRSKDGNIINIYSDGHIDGDGSKYYSLVVNHFTPRFDAIRGVLAHIRSGKVLTKDELDRVFAGF